MGRARRAALLVTLAVCLSLAFSAAPASAIRKIALSSGGFKFAAAPGQTCEGDLVVSNDGDEQIQVLVYAADQITTEDGKLDFIVPGLDAQVQGLSPASWVRLEIPDSQKSLGNIPYLDMVPGTTMPVHFSFTVPEGTPSGDWQVALFFHVVEADVKPEENVVGAVSTVTGRLGARITVRVEGEVIQRLKAEPFQIRELVVGSLAPYNYTISNEGNVDERVIGTLQLLDSSERERFASVVTSETTVYARTTLDQAGVIDFEGVPFGRYTARLTIEHPSQAGASGVPLEVVEDRTVWIVPIWLAVIITLVVGMPLLWLLWRLSGISAVRSRVRKAEQRRLRQERATRARAVDGRDLLPTGESERGVDDESTAGYAG